jgi:hypothetical protein
MVPETPLNKECPWAPKKSQCRKDERFSTPPRGRSLFNDDKKCPWAPKKNKFRHNE